MAGARSGTSVYCDCHGTERLLDLRPGGLEVRDGRHGIKHEAALGPREVLERLTGTVDGSAIVSYVARVVAHG